MAVNHKYTDEEKAFLVEYAKGHYRKEIVEEFNKRFEFQITEGRVKAFMRKYGLKTGFTGRFEKGHIPANKGKKGFCAEGSKKTWFKKGNTPKNHKPVGSERITKDGYIEVKIAEPNKWRMKHLSEWEKANGKIPKGYCIVFLDNDRKNCDIENLHMVSRREHLILNQSKMVHYEGELKKTAINIAKLQIATSERKKK